MHTQHVQTHVTLPTYAHIHIHTHRGVTFLSYIYTNIM